jgi:putative zinc finger/helix-turn-helix YgiT family protein
MISCFECGRTELFPTRVEMQGSVRGEEYTVEMAGFECPSCHYKTIDGTAMPEFGRLLADSYRANHGLLTSEQIRERRRRLGLTQQQFAQRLGVGIASVKRWEMGKIQERYSNDLILRESGSHNSNFAAMFHAQTNAGNIAIAVLQPQSSGSVGFIDFLAASTACGTAERDSTVPFDSPILKAGEAILV